MKTCHYVFLISLIICFTQSLKISQPQQCLDQEGKPVDWWVILNIPGLIGGHKVKGLTKGKYKYPGYAYYDSNDHKAGKKSFKVNEAAPDGNNTALEQTLRQIKKTNMSVIAWNDDVSTCKNINKKKTMNPPFAHSKAIGAYDQQSKKGFFISHSVPKYPCFDKDHNFNVQIDSLQQKNGQSMLCVSGDEQFLKNMISKIPPMLPKVYELNYDCNTLFGLNSEGCQNLFESNGINSPDWNNTYSDFDYKMSGGINFKMIFKRSGDQINQSILDKGVTQVIKSSIISQTWQGNTQPKACPLINRSQNPGYKSQKVVKIKLNKKYKWETSKDHSKWIIATDNNYVCYGDMNRGPKQLPRGGAFYCLNSEGLHKAMWNLVKDKECRQMC